MKTLLIGNTRSHGATRLKEEFGNNGFIFSTVSPGNLIFTTSNNSVSLKDVKGNDLIYHDVFIFRGMGELEKELAVLARFLKSIGKTIVEDVFAEKGVYIDKFIPRAISSEIPVPDYNLIFSPQSIDYLDIEYPVIVKGTDGSMGKKVEFVKTEEELKELLLSKNVFKYPVILQKYLPIDFDYRVMVVGGEVLGAMKRYKKDDDFLTIRAGGRRENVSLPEEALDVAIRSAKVSGLLIAGVDLVEYEGKYYRFEVNMSPQFRVFESVTGVNVAQKIVESIERKYTEKTD